MKKKDGKGSRVGEELAEAFEELAAYMRGEAECTTREVPDHIMTFDRIQAIRKKVATSTKDFERKFGIKARTMEAYESGRRAPDAAMILLPKCGAVLRP
jgi:putative transcriptional regulator